MRLYELTDTYVSLLAQYEDAATEEERAGILEAIDASFPSGASVHPEPLNKCFLPNALLAFGSCNLLFTWSLRGKGVWSC